MPAESKKGPNRIKPSDIYVTDDVTKPVKLRIGEDEISNFEPISVPGLLERTVRDLPDHPALVYKNLDNVYETITYSQYKARVYKIGKAFIKLGLQARGTVAILAFNSPEWFVSELAAIHAGGIATGVYTTNSPDAVFHILNSSNANIVVVDDSKQMAKIREIRHKLPKLKTIIQTLPPYEDYVKEEDGYYKWSDVEAMDCEDKTDEFNRRLENVAINECCVLVYTSGTVGVPKGAMLNHDSLSYDSYICGRRFEEFTFGGETLISYLPLSHVAAQMVDIYLATYFGATVYFADKDALKGSLVKTLKDARPTRFVGVPRVYEKIQEKLMAAGAQTTGVKKIVANWAKNVTLEHYLDVIEGKSSNSWQYRLAKNLVLGKVKEALGLDRCATLLSAAAPMSAEVKKYFMSLDLPIMEAFGMSETAGAHILTLPNEYNFDTIGKTIRGVYSKIINKDEKGHGEILMKGRNIFMGYINEMTKTEEALDNEGWLHSGDIGYIDDKGFVYITGRIKELIITAGGENVPPVAIEHAVKNELFGLSNALLIGDRRKFLTILVSIKTEVDSEGNPLDKLANEALQWMEELNLNYKTLSEILDAGPCPIVYKAIEDGIKRANRLSTSNAQKVQKFAILPHDFSIPTGELGPTLKVKRNVVTEKYIDIIEKLYN